MGIDGGEGNCIYYSNIHNRRWPYSHWTTTANFTCLATNTNQFSFHTTEHTCAGIKFAGCTVKAIVAFDKIKRGWGGHFALGWTLCTSAKCLEGHSAWGGGGGGGGGTFCTPTMSLT